MNDLGMKFPLRSWAALSLLFGRQVCTSEKTKQDRTSTNPDTLQQQKQRNNNKQQRTSGDKKEEDTNDDDTQQHDKENTQTNNETTKEQCTIALATWDMRRRPIGTYEETIETIKKQRRQASTP